MKISPSIISSDLLELGRQVDLCTSSGAYSLHLDVMDGHFVPNLTMGFDMIRSIRSRTKLPLEAHLMIERPDIYYARFIESGANLILVHVEAPVRLASLQNDIISHGGKFGIVVNPETPLEYAYPFLERCAVLLIMSVHPGFSGQKFITSALEKVSEARHYIDSKSLETLIEIDGGINDRTGQLAVDAGADILVSASYIFSGDIEERIARLSSLVHGNGQT